MVNIIPLNNIFIILNKFLNIMKVFSSVALIASVTAIQLAKHDVAVDNQNFPGVILPAGRAIETHTASSAVDKDFNPMFKRLNYGHVK
tara:strand:+ start:87 stop:350 length:264 start_codon:yes stop_codon:yes gene_type:complete